MGRIPSNLTRVPLGLMYQTNMRNLSSTNVALLKLNAQISAQQRVTKPSDDPIAASLISSLDNQLELGTQRERNLGHATGVLNTLDQALGQLSESVLEAKTIASSQVGVGSDAATRLQQAEVIDSILDGVLAMTNRDYAGMYIFGGSRTGSPPIETFHGGFRYAGSGDGLHTDLGADIDFPITLGANHATGAVSARVQGSVDLNASLTAGTFLRDLRGPTTGRQIGTLSITIDDGSTSQTVQVDLSNAETVGDVTSAIESTIRAADSAALGGVFPAGVTLTNNKFSINGIAAGYTINFNDGPVGSTAEALGLEGFTYDGTNAVNTDPAADLNPRVTDRTALGSLNPSTALQYGTITFRNGDRSGTVTTNAGMTIGEFREAVRRLDLGIRVDINSSENGIDVVNEAPGFKMSIEEAGGLAATTLGIRSFSGATLIDDLNEGRGIEIADGNSDPQRNLDFRITLTDGTTFDVDLTPTNSQTIQDVVNTINAAAASAGFGAVFTAGLAANGNGIAFSDTAGGAGAVQVTSLNGYAAQDLGLIGGSFTAGATATYKGADVALVRVDSLFSTLKELSAALRNNDERGITFAGERLEADVDRLASARALVGGRAQRVDRAAERLEDVTLLNKSLKSEQQDLDIIEASSRFQQLQTQMQAALTVAGQTAPLSLLDFLG